jgi:hypothetical protein
MENLGDAYTSLATISAATLTYSHSKTFPANQNVYYRVCAANKVGTGTCSADLTVLTDGPPTFMNAPITTIADIHPSSIVLTWTALADTDTTNNGRDPVIFYDL